MAIIEQVLFVVFFVGAAPLATATLAKTLAEEEIFAWPRAWIEAYCWPMIGYLVSCPKCLSYWMAALITLLCYREWAKITFCESHVAAFICWAAVIRLTVKNWLSDSE